MLVDDDAGRDLARDRQCRPRDDLKQAEDEIVVPAGTRQEGQHALTEKRQQLYKLQRTAAVKSDPEKAVEVRAQIAALSKELAALRKGVVLCDSIAERSGVIQEKIKAVREDEQIKGKEKTDHVQFR